MDTTSGFEQNQTNTDGQWNEVAQVGNSSKFKGRVPVKHFIH